MKLKFFSIFLLLTHMVPAESFQLDLGKLMYGAISPPEMDAVQFRIFRVKNIKNAKALYHYDSHCKELARRSTLDIDTLSSQDLERCSFRPKQKSETVIENLDDHPTFTIFLQDENHFGFPVEFNDLTFSSHWKTDLKPKVKARTDDSALTLCIYTKGKDKKIQKNCYSESVSSADFISLATFLPNRGKSNKAFALYQLGIETYEEVLKEVRGYGFPFGEIVLNKIKEKKMICDGKIIKNVEVNVEVEFKEKSQFTLEGAYYYCLPKS